MTKQRNGCLGSLWLKHTCKQMTLIRCSKGFFSLHIKAETNELRLKADEQNL